MDQSKLIRYLKEEGYKNLRILEDDTIIGTLELAFTRAIFIGLNHWGWEKRFCFEDKQLAITELEKLATGDDEPSDYVARRGK